MSVVIYHNPRCSKSRQTLEILEQRQLQPQVIEYLKTPPDAATLKQLISMLGINARDLLRNKEAEYKTAGLDNPDLSDEDIIAAMVSYPKLIERPIVIIGKRAIIGRPPERVLELIG